MRMEEEVLLMETMSSEDSCYEADQDGKEALTSELDENFSLIFSSIFRKKQNKISAG